MNSDWPFILALSLMGLVLLMLVAGVRHQKKIASLEMPVLEVSADTPQVSQSTGDIWLRIRVYNPTATPIPSCYVRLQDMMTIMSDGRVTRDVIGSEALILPRQGHSYPWQEHGGGIELIRTLPAFETDFVDILSKKKPEILWKTVGVVIYEGRILGHQFNFPVPPSSGALRIILRVGSESVPMKPTTVELMLALDESNCWTCKKVKDAIKQ